jgi:hypothetical protein
VQVRSFHAARRADIDWRLIAADDVAPLGRSLLPTELGRLEGDGS